MKKKLGMGLLLLCVFMQASEVRLPRKTQSYIDRGKRKMSVPHAYHKSAIDYLESMGKEAGFIKAQLLACSGGSMESFATKFAAQHGYNVQTNAVVTAIAIAEKKEPVLHWAA